MTKRDLAKQAQEAIEDLRSSLSPGDTLYTIRRHTSPSGMYRVVDVYIFRDNVPLRLTWAIAQAVDCRYDTKHEGIGVGGCGMDVGFEIVYNLGRVLFHGNFQCIGRDCPSNDHTNGDRDYTPHQHSDAGYALLQRWL